MTKNRSVESYFDGLRLAGERESGPDICAVAASRRALSANNAEKRAGGVAQLLGALGVASSTGVGAFQQLMGHAVVGLTDVRAGAGRGGVDKGKCARSEKTEHDLSAL